MLTLSRLASTGWGVVAGVGSGKTTSLMKARACLGEWPGEGSAWPRSLFVRQIPTMMAAFESNGQSTVLSIVRAEWPRLEPARLAAQAVIQLPADLRQAVDGLVALLAEGSQALVGYVLRRFRLAELLETRWPARPTLLAEPLYDGHRRLCRLDIDAT